MAIIALTVLIYLQQIGQQHPWKAALWACTFGGLTIAAALGAIVHGLKISRIVKNRLWWLLFLSLALTVALFTVGAIFDVWGIATAQKLLPVMLIIGLGFYGVTLVWPDNFFIFIIYQTLAMLFALVSYGWLTLEGRLAGAGFMIAGILATLMAAGVQTNQHVSFKLIWEFDHNGVYHLIQIAGVGLLALGLRASFL